jgi:DNA invertase Pin-like site-specific DNA recombinase
MAFLLICLPMYIAVINIFCIFKKKNVIILEYIRNQYNFTNDFINQKSIKIIHLKFARFKNNLYICLNKQKQIMKAKYIRVSTLEQNTDRQTNFEGLTYIDKCSGSTPFNERNEAKKLLDNNSITEVHVHSIDRLGRSTLDIMQTIQNFTSKGINVVSEKEGLQTIINGKENPIAKLMIGILGTLAEFELSRIKERQSEGIAEAKKNGKYVGRTVGSSETTSVFLNKPKNQKIIKLLNQKVSIRKTALLSSASVGTVQKVKELLRHNQHQ